MDIKKDKGIFYEHIDELMKVLNEEVGELDQAVFIYKRNVHLKEKNLQDVYDEIQDISIVLLSMYNSVRLKKEGYIKESILKG
jgi:NTP pyrophosphatase (non-canonical NTP hydrolase)